MCLPVLTLSQDEEASSDMDVVSESAVGLFFTFKLTGAPFNRSEMLGLADMPPTGSPGVVAVSSNSSPERPEAPEALRKLDMDS